MFIERCSNSRYHNCIRMEALRVKNSMREYIRALFVIIKIEMTQIEIS